MATNAEQERSILVLNRDEAKANKRDAFQPPELLSVASVMQARQEILRLHLAASCRRHDVVQLLGLEDASEQAGPPVLRSRLCGRSMSRSSGETQRRALEGLGSEGGQTPPNATRP